MSDLSEGILSVRLCGYSSEVSFQYALTIACILTYVFTIAEHTRASVRTYAPNAAKALPAVIPWPYIREHVSSNETLNT